LTVVQRSKSIERRSNNAIGAAFRRRLGAVTGWVL